jgi:hypothetical protein
MSAESAQLAALAVNEQVAHAEYIGQHRAAEEIGWRQRLGNIAGKVMLAGALVGSATATGVAMEAQPAAAAGCYGDYCSGQYAGDTGCADDARTIAEAKIIQDGPNLSVNVGPVGMEWGSDPAEVGLLELRTSDNCGTVWARLNTRKPSDIATIGAMHDGGYRQSRVISHINGSPAAVSVSPMVYARGRNTRAFVVAKGSEDGTYWAGR